MSIRYSKRLSIKTSELPAKECIIVQFKRKKPHDHERKRKHNLLGDRMDYMNWMTDDSGVERKNGYNDTMDKYIVIHKINSTIKTYRLDSCSLYSYPKDI